jgi:hypothetical protein
MWGVEISPTVYFDFRNPPIDIPGKNTVLFVVHVLQSSDRPHMKTDVGRFYYRTNKGNEFMSYQQVKEAFLRYEERRNKLSLLYIEILSNMTIAQEIMRISNQKIEKDRGRYLHYSPLRFETALISNLLPEIYSIIYNDGEMVESLFRLKLQMSTLNSTLNIYQSLNPIDMEFQFESHSEHMKKNIERDTLPSIKQVLQGLESRYGLINPLHVDQVLIFLSPTNQIADIPR